MRSLSSHASSALRMKRVSGFVRSAPKRIGSALGWQMPRQNGTLADEGPSRYQEDVLNLMVRPPASTPRGWVGLTMALAAPPCVLAATISWPRRGDVTPTWPRRGT